MKAPRGAAASFLLFCSQNALTGLRSSAFADDEHYSKIICVKAIKRYSGTPERRHKKKLDVRL
jgi:hypothetical protein